MNRIGDAGFLVGLMIIWVAYGTFDISILLTSENSAWQTAGALCIFFGIVGKSAQVPLFTWLPDAMEGPTPVSALIHAATMVAAGVYLFARVHAFFTPDALIVAAIVGMVTALTGALAALAQHDIKKVLAYSTMSQLGLMVTALAMGAVEAALLHLFTHAFFKACLFLAAGSVIHSLHHAQAGFDVQDMRNMGGLRKRMPLTFIAFTIGGASLAGVPFFSGFLSKEAILTSLTMHPHSMSWFAIGVIMIVSFLTVLYTFRLIRLVFLGEERNVRGLGISEPGWQMRLPVLTLALGSFWFVVSPNPFDFSPWMPRAMPAPPYAMTVTIISVAWVLFAFLVAWRLFGQPRFAANGVLMNAFYVDRTYNSFSGNVLRAAHAIGALDRKVIDGFIHASAYAQVMVAHVTGWFDRTFIDGTVNAAARLTGFGGKITRSFQGGNIQLYIFWSVFGIIIFIIYAVK